MTDPDPAEPGERRVWLAQCLCPQRHAIVAAAGEAEDRAGADALIDSR